MYFARFGEEKELFLGKVEAHSHKPSCEGNIRNDYTGVFFNVVSLEMCLQCPRSVITFPLESCPVAML